MVRSDQSVGIKELSEGDAQQKSMPDTRNYQNLRKRFTLLNVEG
jgi:hypothetical protein